GPGPFFSATGAPPGDRCRSAPTDVTSGPEPPGSRASSGADRHPGTQAPARLPRVPRGEPRAHHLRDVEGVGAAPLLDPGTGTAPLEPARSPAREVPVEGVVGVGHRRHGTGRADGVEGVHGVPAPVEQHREGGARSPVHAEVAVGEQPGAGSGQGGAGEGGDGLEPAVADRLSGVLDAVPVVGHSRERLPHVAVGRLRAGVEHVGPAPRRGRGRRRRAGSPSPCRRRPTGAGRRSRACRASAALLSPVTATVRGGGTRESSPRFPRRRDRRDHGGDQQRGGRGAHQHEDRADPPQAGVVLGGRRDGPGDGEGDREDDGRGEGPPPPRCDHAHHEQGHHAADHLPRLVGPARDVGHRVDLVRVVPAHPPEPRRGAGDGHAEPPREVAEGAAGGAGRGRAGGARGHGHIPMPRRPPRD
ncbi:unnamed protein product, partial [Wuchereria bancrofti]